jgi:hypothetical protein
MLGHASDTSEKVLTRKAQRPPLIMRSDNSLVWTFDVLDDIFNDTATVTTYF